MDSTPDRIRIIPELLGAFNIAAQQNRISFIRGVKYRIRPIRRCRRWF